MQDKKSFIMYKNWMPMLLNLPDESAAQILKAVAAYQIGEKYEITDIMANAVFLMIKNTFDDDAAKYEDTCQKRAEAGKLGAEKTNEKKRQKSANAENVDGKSRQKSANADDKDKEKDKEKDKDKDKDKELKDSCAEASPAPLADCASIPLLDGTEYTPTLEDFKEYQEAYPAVDAYQAFREMRSWSNSNPKNKKTVSGIKRFINSWLSREQNRARPSPKAETPPKAGSFNDFSQRGDDYYNAIERALLTRPNDEEKPPDGFASKLNIPTDKRAKA